jgi:hypothetical protein
MAPSEPANMNAIKTVLDYVNVLRDIDIDTDNPIEIIKNISFRLTYKDPVLTGELTTPYIEMLNQYQESVYYAYLSVIGKKEDLRSLTNEEKEALSLKFKIEPGSDIIDIAAEHAEKIINIIGEKMNGLQLLIAILALLGYLSIDQIGEIIEKSEQKEVDKANIERETKLYDTFQEISEKLIGSSYMHKRQEAIEKPLAAYDNNKLMTEEMTIKSSDVDKPSSVKSKTSIVIEGEFFVDGMTGYKSDRRTFYLLTSEEKHSVQLGRNDLDILKTNKLMNALGKTITAKLTIHKTNGNITKKVIEDVSIIEEKQ